MSDFGVFWIGICIVIGCWFIGSGLRDLGEAIREAAADDDLSGFYEH
jgi:hypothetical protein